MEQSTHRDPLPFVAREPTFVKVDLCLPYRKAARLPARPPGASMLAPMMHASVARSRLGISVITEHFFALTD
jgi:hypothetical protein